MTENSATLTTGEVIPTRLVIWTAGIRVNPVLETADLPKNQHGAIQVNGQLQVLDHPTIFALGDCAAVPTPDGQGFYAPTAQNSERQGPVAAANVAATIRGWSARKTFAYKPIGSLASLGQRQAVAQISKYRFSGLPAWFAWRGIYLAKLPTLSDKVRVGLDWISDLFAPVDTVQLPIVKENLAATEARLNLPSTAMPATGTSNGRKTVSPAAPTAG